MRKKLNTMILACTNQAKVTGLMKSIAEVEQQLKTSYDAWRLAKEVEACSNIKQNPSSFFKFIGHKSNIKSRIGPFVDKNGDPIADIKVIAEGLQKQYSSVYSNPDPKHKIEDVKKFFGENNRVDALLDIYISEDDVIKALRELKPSFGSGPDNLPAILLKHCSPSLSAPLAQFFNNSIQLISLPALLKLAMVIPIHKGGSCTLPA